jgi:hypothetical protein
MNSAAAAMGQRGSQLFRDDESYTNLNQKPPGHIIKINTLPHFFKTSI